MKLYNRYLQSLSFIENVLMTVVMTIMLSITFANIIGRKFLDTSWAFAEEITVALFVLITLVGAAVAARRGAHLGLSVLTDLLPKHMQKIVALVMSISGLVVCILLVDQGLEMVKAEIMMDMRTGALGWPEWWFGSFVPVGGALMGLEFINFAILAFIRKEQ